MGRTLRLRTRKRTVTIKSTLFNNFYEWIASHGVILAPGLNLEFDSTSCCRGIITTYGLRTGQRLLCVPDAMIIKPCQSLRLVSQHDSLIEFLLRELKLGDESAWYRYLQWLPNAFEEMPSFGMSIKAIRCLPGFIRDNIMNQRNLITDSYRRHLSCDSWSIHLWAWMVVNTRCVYVDKSRSMTLIPFLDMFNHNGSDAQIDTSVDTTMQSGSFILTSNSTVKPGEQVFINYGPHDNAFLFVEYGFILPYNQLDFIPLMMDDLQLDHSNVQGNILHSMDIRTWNDNMAIVFNSNSGFSWNVLAILAVFLSSPHLAFDSVCNLDEDNLLNISYVRKKCKTILGEQLQRLEKSIALQQEHDQVYGRSVAGEVGTRLTQHYRVAIAGFMESYDMFENDA